MADPLSASAVLAALKAEGVKVVEVGDWRTHSRNRMGPWGPVHGVMIHHTVTSGAAKTVAICRDGYAALPGPLCHGVIAKDGTVHLVGWGRANHAGKGDDDVLRAVIAEDPLPADNEANTDGNARFYGFECENLGDGKDPWPAAQLLAIEKVSAAICRHHGWGAASVIGHLEWQPGKVDPRGFTMASMRARIADRLGATPGTPEEEEDMALTDADLDKIARLVWAFSGDDPLQGGDAKVSKERLLWGIASRLARVEKAVDGLDVVGLTDAQVQALADRLAAAPGLADAIASKVADLLAARLAE